MNASQPLSIASVKFVNFKGLKDFSFTVDRANILVGPNNSGKSTVIAAFRVLAVGIQRANARNPEILDGPGGVRRRGYRLAIDSLPISIENIHTDYDPIEATVTFQLSNGNRLLLFFPPEGWGCHMFAETASGKSVADTKGFKRDFPLRLGVVPVLGPVEHDEEIVEEETVKRNLQTHRASRHFRNYWRFFPEQFGDFRQLVSQTWPNMEILEPELVDILDRRLRMFCIEGGEHRELFWAGFGFQVWCQILTHVVRNREATMFVIDEPEIYLHADLQRQLLAILKESPADVLMATHSAEIIGEADPTELVIVDKRNKSARRVRGVEGVAVALQAVGSLQNVTLTQLARTRRVLYVEGEDWRLIRRLARINGLDRLAAGTDFAVVPLGGFPEPSALKQLSQGMTQAVGMSLLFGGIFDRDYRCPEELAAVHERLIEDMVFAEYYQGKEVENYTLSPAALQKATNKALEERALRTGSELAASPDVDQLLLVIADEMRDDVMSQLISHKIKFLQHTGRDPAQLTKEAAQQFRAAWSSASERLHLLPGKATLKRLNELLQSSHGMSLTQASIVSQLTRARPGSDLSRLLSQLDSFRQAVPQ